MELKVWMEGIQRVVCGVDERTTCHDLILAMAHATGRTGRFAMIERWRGKERRLSPTDNPVRILQKWGEYATDIQFILRHSSGSKRSAVSLPERNLVTPAVGPLSRKETSSTTKLAGKLQKSRTFSGAHACDLFLDRNSNVCGIDSASARSRKDVGLPLHINHSLESSEQSSMTSQSSASLSPYPSLERSIPHRTVNCFAGSHLRTQATVHAGNNCVKDLTPVALIKPNILTSFDVLKQSSKVDDGRVIGWKDRSLIQPKTKLLVASSLLSFESKSDKLLSEYPKVAQNGSEVVGRTNDSVESGLLNGARSKDTLYNNNIELESNSKHSSSISNVSGPGSTKSFASTSAVAFGETSSVKTSKDVETFAMDSVKALSNRFLVNSFPRSDERASGSSQSSSGPCENRSTVTDDKSTEVRQSSKFAEARANFLNRETEESTVAELEREKFVRLCKEQKEELEKHGSELTVLLADVAIVEDASRSTMNQHQLVLVRLEELEQEERRIDSELMDLELVSWEDKREMELQKVSKMTTELALLKSSVARSEKDIVRIEEKNRLLATELDSATRQQGAVDRNVSVNEHESLKILEDLRRRLAEARSRKVASETALEGETQTLDKAKQNLADKQNTVDHLNQALKLANLNLFTLHSRDVLDV